jgi:trehalose 6-phosphate phosphatase
MPAKIEINLNRYEAAIFDMDGVITQSARAHLASWKRMFDEYLRAKAESQQEKFTPFSEEDYYKYVDGKPRYEGAQSFLESRVIKLPYGKPDDDAGKETVCGLGNRKNQYFLKYLEKNGAESYQSTIDFIEHLQAKNKRVAAISSSRNAKAVLKAAGVTGLFHVVVDGVISSELNLKGKPAPDIFLEAARRLKVNPGEAIVVEDALSGVEAGKAGGFGLVIGVNRSGENSELKNHGADIVVGDLSELTGESYDSNKSK